MNIVVWIVQILAALAFGASGFFKIAQPIDSLAQMMPWVTALPAVVVRFIGVAELLGAIGLILPGLTKIQPRLTVYAGVGLVVVMILAALFHITRGEFGNIGANAVLGVLAAVVAFVRRPWLSVSQARA